MSEKLRQRLLPYSGLLVLLGLWSFSVNVFRPELIPGPWDVVLGLLFKYIVASLFRVTWGYLLAAGTAIPIGFLLGYFRRGDRAFGPIIQILRPISPLAWIPLAILWFGVGDSPAVFIIFLGSFFPIVVTAIQAMITIDPTHINAGRNFGLTPLRLVWKVILPATVPQLVVGLRLALGIAWLVVVAAEMIAVNSGLGFLVIDARNAGNRYDLVVCGMLLIGVTGILLDLLMRRLENTLTAQWGYSNDGKASSAGASTKDASAPAAA
jgi:NitT/TauT family transport system permease protein